MLIAEHAFPNAVVNEGANLLLETMFRATPPVPWYIGLINSGAVLNNSDTMASHTGWTELSSYSEAVRPQWIVNNPTATRILVNAPADAGVLHFSGAASLGGAFLEDNSAKGGTTGRIFCTAIITPTLNLISGDAVAVSYQLQVT